MTFTAAFTDPDSRITGYEWDFDGNNTVDQTTAGPSVQHAYPAAGTFAAKVGAKDFRGGRGTAGTTVTVAPAAGPPGGGSTTPTPTTPPSGGGARPSASCR